jgi:hypothetical protein
MSKEIRRVPINWEHPKDENGFKPLSDNIISTIDFIIEDLNECKKKLEEFFKNGKVDLGISGFTDFNELTEYLFEDIDYSYLADGHMPNGDWYQLYETVTEGTPITPPFATADELIDWLSNNEDYHGEKWTVEAAKHIVDTGYAPTFIFTNGKLYSSEEQHLID